MVIDYALRFNDSLCLDDLILYILVSSSYLFHTAPAIITQNVIRSIKRKLTIIKRISITTYKCTNNIGFASAIQKIN